MFKLPSKNSPIREMFDMTQLAQVGNRELVITLQEAKQMARRVLLNPENQTKIAGVSYIVVLADGTAALYTFRVDMPPAKVWEFGKI